MRNPKQAVGDTWKIYWSTQDEIEFLDGVGKEWRKQDGPQDPNLRFKCLMGYRDSILKRSNWGDINRNEIVKYLNKILADYGIEELVIKTKGGEEKMIECSVEEKTDIEVKAVQDHPQCEG